MEHTKTLRLHRGHSMIDLFCGVGSFRSGFESLGYRCVYACDNNNNVQKKYKRIFGHLPDGDIKLCGRFPRADLLCAGFPCQAFSLMGKRGGMDDVRVGGDLFWEIERCIRDSDPRVLVLENVRGLLSHRKGLTFALMRWTLLKLGYHVTWKIIRCHHMGVPQHRNRLFVVGCKRNRAHLLGRVWKERRRLAPRLSVFLGDGRILSRRTKTIRVGGRHSPFGTTWCWNKYTRMAMEPYELTIKDACKLQGQDPAHFTDCSADWQMLGNTIPTNMTDYVAKRVHSVFFQ